MDNVLINTAAPHETRNEPQGGVPKPSARFEWTWIVLVCVLLGISGGIRYWRDRQFQSLSKKSEVPPFPLKEFPKVLGSWRNREGLETTLDPQIARMAGASDHLIRTYVDEKSGETVVVMILYGLARIVGFHTPDRCFPAAGFKMVPPSRDVEIQVPDSTTTARFRAENYVKNRAGSGIYEEVYHSFLNDGRWGTDIRDWWKFYRYHPGMFKVQVQRQVSSLGKTENSPVEGLLGKIVEEIERRLATQGSDQSRYREDR